LENSNQHTPLFVAVVKGFLDVADALEGLSSLDVKDMAGDTPLHWAVMLGNAKSVAFLLEHRAAVDLQNYNKNTPLMVACTNGHAKLVQMLVHAGASVNRENAGGLTPLHAACMAGSIEIVDFLLDNGADFTKKDKRNFLPVHYAVVKDQVELLRHLQTERHFSILQKKYFYEGQQSLLALAVLNGGYHSVKLLAAEWGDDLEARDAEGNTYLHLAAIGGHVNIFLFLLSKQISIQSKNARGKTAIDLAKIYKQEHLIRYLRENFEQTNLLKIK